MAGEESAEDDVGDEEDGRRDESEDDAQDDEDEDEDEDDDDDDDDDDLLVPESPPSEMSVERDEDEDEEADKFTSASEGDTGDEPRHDGRGGLASPVTPSVESWASRSPTPIGGRLGMPSLVYAPRPYSAPKPLPHP